MLIDISNTCRMGCPHCMQRATPEPQHMTDEVFRSAVEFAKSAGVRVVLVSGGEPSYHPKCLERLNELAAQFFSVSLLTNGIWATDNDAEDGFSGRLLALLSKHKNISIQVSSFPRFYKDYSIVIEGLEKFKKRLKDLGLKHRLHIETDDRIIESKMLALGRAADSEELCKMASVSEGTTSCFASALVSAQVPFERAIEILESRGKFCHPLVDWQGNLHWSESWLCPSFANIHEPFQDIARKACEWRPCRKCKDWAKAETRAKTEVKYAMGLRILGLNNE